MWIREYFALLIYSLPFLAAGVSYLIVRGRRHRRLLAIRDAAIKAGLNEPASLHPVINPNRCIGCSLCANACPENMVLGVISGKSELIDPSHCIGHGACKTACPVNAISLVFGTETRGVDIPFVKPNFETNIPGIFIAGELGGMGLIRNAVSQGRQAVDMIAKIDGIGRGEDLDLVIVGAGPAGFAATLAAKQLGLRFVTVEQETLGGTVAHYPRGKVVMTAPMELPLVGKVNFTETTKEALLEFWQSVERKADLDIFYQERVEEVTRADKGFVVQTGKNAYRTRAVLLAIGRRGTPRKLEVPGEHLNKVVYRLIDSEQYRGKNVLVVGGGDSAIEAAVSIAAERDAAVTLSYRGDGFARAKEKNRISVEQSMAAGRLNLLLRSNVKEIGEDRVHISQEDRLIEVPNEAVIVAAGGILPTPFLRKIGIEVETKYGTL
ncbi:MAG: NAD(P)-binding domain-containing protein [Alphaproteobacteria bacterium]|nr:NAD(P)-binding domain-containing protein [Alphaproteobacteria bacterium]